METFRFRRKTYGVPAVVQWVKDLTETAWVAVEAWVRYLAWHSGLRTQHCCSCGIGRSCSSKSIPGLGTSICHECSQKEIKIERKEGKGKEWKKKEKRKKRKGRDGGMEKEKLVTMVLQIKSRIKYHLFILIRHNLQLRALNESFF